MRQLRSHAMLAICILLFPAFAAAQATAEQSPQSDQDQVTIEASEADPDTSSKAITLTPMQATYSASLKKGIPFKGSATRSLEQREDGTWVYRFDVDSFIADIRETTHLRWDGEQVIPSRYRYSLEGLMISDRANSIDFNWAQNMASGKEEGDSFRLEIPPQALDPLSFQLQLQLDLQKGKQEMLYQVVDEDDLDEEKFAVIGNERLESKLGPVDTVKMEKVRAPDKKRQTNMWFAPEWGYVLVRLVQIEDDGTRYEINLESAEIDGQKIVENKD